MQVNLFNFTYEVKLLQTGVGVHLLLFVVLGENLDAHAPFEIDRVGNAALDDPNVSGASGWVYVVLAINIAGVKVDVLAGIILEADRACDFVPMLAGDVRNAQLLFGVDRRAIGDSPNVIQSLLHWTDHVEPDRVLAGGVELGGAVFNLDAQTLKVFCVLVFEQALLHQEMRCGAFVCKAARLVGQPAFPVRLSQAADRCRHTTRAQ
ncbi:hypothetical protein D3C72_1036960 [compost metagenome]